MPIDLYYMSMSAPCRAVLLTAKMVGVEINLKTINLMQGEHMKPEFLKINPQHTVPCLDDSGFVVTESRAICAYLANKVNNTQHSNHFLKRNLTTGFWTQYGKNDKLYPKDPKDRALVDQRLYFDLGVFYASFADCYVNINTLFKKTCLPFEM